MTESGKTAGVPVFALADITGDGNVDASAEAANTLPSILITMPVEGANRGMSREVVGRYPDDGMFPDADGQEALYWGGRYYDEGMSYTDGADRRTRIDCFRATELLYLHAAARGKAFADLCLGYVYSYDRCEGEYWTGSGAPDGVSPDKPYPREKRAYECYLRAAEAGSAQAWYRVGDLSKQGVGCDVDLARAFESYTKAAEVDDGRIPSIWGSIALRLAECYEEGIGCVQSFERAHVWYDKAVTGLDFAVRGGDDWYRQSLKRARNGLVRCRQELDGRY